MFVLLWPVAILAGLGHLVVLLTKVEYEKRRLEDVNQAMHDVEHAAVKARVVFDLT